MRVNGNVAPLEVLNTNSLQNAGMAGNSGNANFGDSAEYGDSASLAVSRQRVLNNTYALLGASLIPTALGAWLGVASSLGATMRVSPIITLIVFLVGAFGFMYAIERNKTSSVGVFLLLAFTFFMGVMLSQLLGMVLGFKNGSSLIMSAFGGTAVIFLGMASLGTMIKRELSGLGKFLSIGALLLFFASIVGAFFPMPMFQLTLMVLVIIIFSLYMLYDVNRIVTGGETNYISATLALYMSIYNVFQSLLMMLGIFGGDRE